MDIKTKLNFVIVGLFLVLCVFVVYVMPRAKYAGKAITADILDSIPKNGQYWQGEDIEGAENNLQGEMYDYISRIFASQYVDTVNPKQKVFLLVLDAGNFHYPKVCFKGAGFSTEELSSRELKLEQTKIKAHLMLSKKKNEQLLSIYWICIDKKIVPTWAEQKLKQLYYSLFNKKRVGLMVRVDIHIDEDMEKTVKIGEKFLSDIYQAVPSEYREYIFGKI